MKKILILGASPLQVPAIQKAKELGYITGVLDMNPNAVGIPMADDFFECSTIDIEKIIEIAKEYKPDGILTIASDLPMRAVAKVSQELGLSSISTRTALLATDKAEMIQQFEKDNVNHPWFYILESKEDLYKTQSNLSYPCIIKPSDNSGSRGVVYITSESELEEGYIYSVQSSRCGTVIVEEYLEGKEVSVEIVIANDDINIIAITDKITTGAPHFVELGHCEPSLHSEVIQHQIRELAKSAVRSLGINTGTAHVEIMVTANGPKIIEVGARMGGDFISTHLVKLSTGIDMTGLAIQLACNEDVTIPKPKQLAAAITYIKPQSGVITSIEGVEKAKTIKGVNDVMIFKKNGDTCSGIRSSNDRVGCVISQATTREKALEICEAAAKQIIVKYRKVKEL